MRKKLTSFLLAMLCFVIAGKAQTLTISGRVTDEQGAPIPFVSVLVKGKSGTTTDVEGRFSITAQRGDVLVISGVGYAAKEVTVGTSTQLEITLAPAKENLSEVVVTAMGIKKQERALGYAVSKVDPQTMLQKSESNVLNTLAGKIPGVDIRAGQGAPGAASRIQIRGVTTFTGGTEPLIVVDGVPYSNPLINTTNPFSGGGTYGSGINNLDPNDIESISVLKGSAAASLYGSRASNGVVLITTKSGSPKKGAKSLNVTYRAGYSWEKIADIPEFQNLYGAGANYRAQPSNGSWGARFGKGVIYDLSGNVIGVSASGIDSIPASTWATMYASYPELFPNGRIAYKAVPDNVAKLFNTGNLMEHSVGLSGGEGNTLFNVTLSHLDQDGYITNSSYRKSNMSVGGQTAVGKLTIGANVSYARSKQVGGFIGQAQSFLSQWGRTYTMARNWDIAGWPSEDKSGRQIGFNDGQYTNPIWGAYHNTITSIDDRLVANLRASYKFNNWARLEFSGGVNNYTLFRDQIIDKSSYGGADNALGTITEVVSKQQEINGRLLAVFNPRISNDWTLDINAGMEVNERNSRHQQVYGVDFVIPGQYNLQNTRRQTFSGDNRSKRRLVGFFADASLGYRNFVFLNVTSRVDLTSTLPYENAQYFYPGVSTSLVWTELLKDKPSWLDYGKIRAGYARVGSDAPALLGELVYSLSAAGFLGQPLSTRGGRAVDPQLTPEFSSEIELGAETRFFNGRAGFEVTWYNKKSTDLIDAINLPQTTGYSSFLTNFGAIRNKGIEAAVDVTPLQNKDFNWNVRVIFTRNINTVEELIEGVLRRQLGGFNWAEPGMPFGYLRGSYSARDPETGQLLIHPLSGMPLVEPNQGMVGDPNPDFKAGLNNSFSWRGFTLNFLFDVTYGGDFYSETISSMLGRGVTKDTEDREKFAVISGIYGNPNAVTGADGLNHYVPLLVGGKTVPNQTKVTWNDLFFTAGTGASFATNGAFEYSVFDGTVYRLREIGLSYTLPSKLVRSIKLTNITISATGRNLWYYAPKLPKYTNFDPDMNSVVSGFTQGVETGGAPSTKRYGLNLNVTF